MGEGLRRTTAVLGVLVCLAAASVTPAAADEWPPTPPPPADPGLTLTTLRGESVDAAYAVVRREHWRYLIAGSAGGDFGLAAHSRAVGDGFGHDTKVTTDFGFDDEVAFGVAESDGRITVVGTAGGDLAVARYDDMGRIDWSFGDHGRLRVDLGGPDDVGHGVVALPDGGVVVAGGGAGGRALLWISVQGTVTNVVESPGSGPWRAMATDSDGRLLVVSDEGESIVAARFTPAGELDSGFGAGGVATIALGAESTGNAVVVDAASRIVIAGSVGGDLVLARLLPTGATDGTFGIAGVVRRDLGGADVGNGVSLKPDGEIVAVGTGSAEQVGFLAGFDATGVMTWWRPVKGKDGHPPARLAAVSTSDPDGEVLAVGTDGEDFAYSPAYPWDTGWIDMRPRSQGARDSAVQPDGKVVVAGEAGGDIALARYRPDGTLDTSFGRGGVAVSDAAMLSAAVAVQPGGRIVVTSLHGEDMALVGFTPDGRLDNSFGTNGRTIADLGGNLDIATGLVSLPDGRLVLNARVSGVGMVLTRFDATGHLDPTFGNGGRSTPLPGYSSFEASSLVVQTDGKLLATAGDLAVYRFLPDGVLDPTFNGTGRVPFQANVDFGDVPSTIALQPDGKILLGGWARGSYGCNEASIMRLNSDGSRDPTFEFKAPDWRNGWTHCRDSAVARLAVEPDGHVLAAADVSRFLRLDGSGVIDRNVGFEGLLDDLGIKGTRGLVPLPDGDVLAIGSQSSWSNNGFFFGSGGFAVARLALGPRGAPSGVTVQPLAAGAQVRWERPAGVDAAPIAAYEVSTADGHHRARTRDAATLQVILRGLPVGVPQTFTVRAVRPSGVGPESRPTSPAPPSRTTPVASWGWNALGQLGDATAVDRPGVGAVRGLTGVTAVAAGIAHSLALRDDGTVWAWGWNPLGQLGDGTLTDRPLPVRVQGLSGVQAIAAGGHHNLAVTSDGSVWAWGWNALGQLGDGTLTDRRVPVRVLGPGSATSVAGGLAHSLALAAGGIVRAWGWNAYGQVGDGTRTDRVAPVRAETLTGADALSAGWLHSLALVDEGVWGWGWNGVGQLGDGTFTDRTTPTRAFASGVTGVAAGAYHSAVVLTDGRVMPWGWNGYGQLGIADPVPPVPSIAVEIPGFVVSVVAGAFHNVAVTEDGRVFSWGWDGFGQVGDGPGATSGPPVELGTLGTTQAVGAGYLHSLAA